MTACLDPGWQLLAATVLFTHYLVMALARSGSIERGRPPG